MNTNPEYQWYYFDDDKCKEFIHDNFEENFCKMYDSLPLGVMQADVWRVAVVYIYGGVYADIDTCCLHPIDQWISNDKELVVGIETPAGELNNYIFAAEAKHPALLSVLECFCENYSSSDYLKDLITPVQNFGANAFSRGIRKYIKQYQSSKICIYPYEEHRFSPYVTENTFVEHQVGSDNWKYTDYTSWRVLEKQILGV